MTDLSTGIPPTSTALVPPGTYDLRVHTGCVDGSQFFTVRVNLGYPVTVAELDNRMSEQSDKPAEVIRIEPVPAPETNQVTLDQGEYELLMTLARNSLVPLRGVAWAKASARLDEITAHHG